jgi:YHS domain-containing protein
MNDSPDWEQKIQNQLVAADQRKREVQNHWHQRMTETERRWQQFGPLADRLARTVIRPRMEKLASYFDNARFLPPEQAGRYHCACQFQPTERFPAKVKLELSVGTDGRAENLIVRYDLQILPIFFHFQGESEISFPLDAVDEGRLTAWVEERIVGFVGTYLRLEELEPYQRDNLVTDPVCGMVIQKPLASAHVEYLGRPYYFCVEECRQKFAADPERYASGAKSPSASTR